MELTSIQQRIEQLEGSHSPAVESRGVKRERSENVNEIEELAPPPKKIAAVVDLTEDE